MCFQGGLGFTSNGGHHGLSLLQSKSANPASDNKSIASCFPGTGSPYDMSKLADAIPFTFISLVTHPLPEKSPRKLYAWPGHCMQIVCGVLFFVAVC